MRFSEMNPTKRQQWLDWARSHDWGHNASLTNGESITGCRDIYTQNGKLYDVEAQAFYDPKILRDWAGY